MTTPHLRPESEHQRGSVHTIDLADALLEAYAEIKRRAFRIYLERGRLPGHALDDWIAAERELSLPAPVNLSESEDLIQALATLPDFSAGQISVAIEGSMALILVHSEDAQTTAAGKYLLGEPQSESATGGNGHENLHRDPRDSRRHVEFFTAIELSKEVDRVRSVAVFTDGVLAIRMSKK